MTPGQLQPAHFRSYPPQARQTAVENIALLRRLPVSFLPLLLQEVILYDWRFPAERKEIDRQLAYLSKLSPDQLANTMSGFTQVRVAPELERLDWVASPAEFSEQLSKHLWTTGQIEVFRPAAVKYVEEYNREMPEEAPVAPPLAIVVIGKGVSNNRYPLFRKLRPFGVYYDHVNYRNGLRSILDAVARRSIAHPAPYAHWYIDGGVIESDTGPEITCVSYAGLSSLRRASQSRMQRAIESGIGPEAISSMLARIQPEELGLSDSLGNGVLNRFTLSLFTEGAGTQIYSTTFVQWTTREVLRRAKPLTLIARYVPRQKERPMNELLSETLRQPESDAPGSLVDADMGAYYTWLNQQRLKGAGESSFLVWFEDHGEALAISPSLRRRTDVRAPTDLEEILNLVTETRR